MASVHYYISFGSERYMGKDDKFMKHLVEQALNLNALDLYLKRKEKTIGRCRAIADLYKDLGNYCLSGCALVMACKRIIFSLRGLCHDLHTTHE